MTKIVIMFLITFIIILNYFSQLHIIALAVIGKMLAEYSAANDERYLLLKEEQIVSKIEGKEGNEKKKIIEQKN